MSRPALLSTVAMLAVAAALPAQMHQHGAHQHAAPAAPPSTAATAAPAASIPSAPLAADILVGEAVPFGKGTARTLVALDVDGSPKTLGVSFSATALDGLPPEAPADDLGWLYRLPLPTGVALPPYDHVGLYWNPLGHEPRGVYDVGHFDVHFFLSPPEQLDRITAVDRDLELVYRLPPASAIPPGYFLPPGTQHRRMGVHWIDGSAGELHGETFTATFIIGSYDQQVNFLEPMITRAFLASRPDMTKPVAQPADVARAGWYPTTWSVRWDEQRGEYLVLLDSLQWREASLPAPATLAAERSATSSTGR